MALSDSSAPAMCVLEECFGKTERLCDLQRRCVFVFSEQCLPLACTQTQTLLHLQMECGFYCLRSVQGSTEMTDGFHC